MARGIPNNPVPCKRCNDPHGCPKDKLCHRCRIRSRRNPNKRYDWTPSLDLALIRSYRTASSRQELSRNLDALQLRSGFTRVVIVSRAATLGLGAKRRRWTNAETEALIADVGRVSKAAIAKKLKRSYWSVKAEVSRLELRSRVTDGYSQSDVACLLGASPRSVRKWIGLGWLRLQHSRITEASLIRFLRTQPEEYQLNRVDEAWFKGLLFTAFGRNSTHSLGMPSVARSDEAHGVFTGRDG